MSSNRTEAQHHQSHHDTAFDPTQTADNMVSALSKAMVSGYVQEEEKRQ